MKNKLMRAATLLMVLTLMTSCFVGSTFAKYTSTGTATDMARVAKWSITIDGTDIVQTDSVTFNLFDTVTEVDGLTTDGDIAQTQVIAPGTGGKFNFSIENKSEVNAVYSITLAETETGNIPLEYSLDGTTWEDSIADLNGKADLTDVAINMDAGAANSAAVYWRWAFNGNESSNYISTQTDSTDTELGAAGTATVTITATFTATQVN